MSEKIVKEALMYQDRDGDGILDYTDLLATVRSLGVYWNQADEDKNMASLGMKAPDTKIPASQLVGPVTAIAGSANARKVLTDMFKKFDRAGDGTIAEKELSEILKCLGELLPEKDQEGLCKLASKNGRIVYADLVDKIVIQ